MRSRSKIVKILCAALLIVMVSTVVADSPRYVFLPDGRIVKISNNLSLPSPPGADRIMFYDFSGGVLNWLEAGAGLTITGTTLNASGVSTFTSLTDTPGSYSGQAGLYAKVNGGETAIEFGSIDVSDDTNLAVSSPVTLTGDTLGWLSTLIDSPTWSDGSNATNTWTFDVSGTDHTMIAGSGLMTFSHNVTVDGTISDGTASMVGGSLTNVKLGSLTDNGLVKTESGDGSLSVDTNTYVETPILIAPASVLFGSTGNEQNQEYDIDGETWVTSGDGTPDQAGHLLADVLTAIETSYDDSFFSIREGSGVLAGDYFPLTTEFTFEGVTTFASIIIRDWYDGSASHFLSVELLNIDTNWDTVATQSASADYEVHEYAVLNPVDYIDAGVAKLRLRHIQNGISSHHQEIDYLVLSTGAGGGGGGVQTAIQTPSTTTGDIGSTNVQGAIEELEAEKIPHSLADAANDFLVASGNDAFVKKTLAETGAILEGDIIHDNLQGVHQSVTSGAAPTFTADNFSDGGSNAIITTTQETNFETAFTHVTQDGSSHSLLSATPGTNTASKALIPDVDGKMDTYITDELIADIWKLLNSGDVTATWTGSQEGYADFPGSADYVTISDHADFNWTSAGFTVSFWMRSTDSSLQSIVEQGAAVGNAEPYWGFLLADTGKAFFIMGDGAATPITMAINSMVQIDTNAWVHLVGVFDGDDTIELYVDNVKGAGAAGEDQDVSFVIDNPTDPIVFGRRNTDADRDYTGQVNNVMYFDAALGSAEIAAIFALGETVQSYSHANLVSWWKLTQNFTDSIDAHDGTVTGDVTITVTDTRDLTISHSFVAGGSITCFGQPALLTQPDEASLSQSGIDTGGGGTAVTDTDTFDGGSQGNAYTIGDIVEALKLDGTLKD